MKFQLFFAVVFCHITSLFAQQGCTDHHAINYNSSATINDGSCLYPPTTLSLNLLCRLDTPALNESSGIAGIDNSYWTMVDDGYASIFRIDTLSDSVFQQLTINQAINKDWEDITANSDYIFVGSFGNNPGNRTDLHILKIDKHSFNDSSVTVDAGTIYFSYEDQTDFTLNQNNHSFDCEAFFFLNDSIHLFTKDWKYKRTKHYVIPADTGVHVAVLVDSFNVNGLITSAAIQDDGLIVLTGYNLSGSLQSFMWMLYDYQGTKFFSGNKRRFSLGSLFSVGQTEGVCFRGDNYGYITNERFGQGANVVPPQIRSFDLTNYLLPPSTVSKEDVSLNRIKIYPSLFNDKFTISLEEDIKPNTELMISDASGKCVIRESLDSSINAIDASFLPSGNYQVKVFSGSELIGVSKIIKH